MPRFAALGLRRSQNPVEIPEKSSILIWSAGADPDPFGLFVFVDGANDHSAFQELLEYLFAVADTNQNKI